LNRVKHRLLPASGRNGYLLVQHGNAQFEVDLGGFAGLYIDLLRLFGQRAGGVGGKRVCARRNVLELEAAVVVGHGRSIEIRDLNGGGVEVLTRLGESDGPLDPAGFLGKQRGAAT